LSLQLQASLKLYGHGPNMKYDANTSLCMPVSILRPELCLQCNSYVQECCCDQLGYKSQCIILSSYYCLHQCNKCPRTPCLVYLVMRRLLALTTNICNVNKLSLTLALMPRNLMTHCACLPKTKNKAPTMSKTWPHTCNSATPAKTKTKRPAAPKEMHSKVDN
jgi:hypothetical protein